MRYFSELFGNAVFMSCLPLFLWEPSKITLTFAAFVSSIKIMGDFYIGRKIKNEMNCLLYLLSPLKDIFIGFMWFIPLLSNTVIWRGNRYIIGKDSMFPHALKPVSGHGDTGLWMR